MFRTLQWQALLLGFGAAAVVASLVATVVWAAASALGRENVVTGAVVVGVLAGLMGAGYVAGRLSMRKMFHGTLTALAFGFGVTLASMAGGSRASVFLQAWFLVIAAGLGAFGAYVASRAR